MSYTSEIYDRVVAQNPGEPEFHQAVKEVLDSLKVLYDEYQDPKFKACPLLKEFVRCGKLGRKTGHGFFDYV